MIRRSPTRRFRRLAAVVLLAPAGFCGSATGGNDRVPIGYEYATWLGTGGFRVGGRDLFILRLPFHKRLRASSDHRYGLSLLLPVSIGWLDKGALVSEDLQTLTFVPGVELDFQVAPNWRLQPFAQLGLGKDFAYGDLAYIGAAGVKSKYGLTLGDCGFALGNALVLAGSQPNGDGPSSSFSRFDAGIEVHRPIDLTIAGRRARLGAFYIASFFASDAGILRLDADRDGIGTVHTFGLALGVQTPVRLFGLDLDWLGLSYLSGQGLQGIQLNTGFPF